MKNTFFHLHISAVLLGGVICGTLYGEPWKSSSTLPVGNAPPALTFPHFPGRQYAFVFRNWNLVNPDRLAAILQTTPDKVTELGNSMGLVARRAPDNFIRRGYITLLRRNWHLLPYEQLMQLVDMSPSELGNSLLEDDFLFIKFGRLKPRCKPLRWSEPTAEQSRRAEEIKRFLYQRLGSSLAEAGEPRFHFVKNLSAPMQEPDVVTGDFGDDLFELRFIYSYFGLFGDPLMNSELASFPTGLLQRLAAKGVNGIWLHTILRNLTPSGGTVPSSDDHQETRLENLRRLVDRAGKYGIGVYLYLNEPRALPHTWFESHPNLAGVRESEVTALCTSVPEVQTWLVSSLAHVFQETPGLAGVFTITASENLTHCASHGNQRACPRCRDRDYDTIIAEVNALIERGVHQGNPKAKVIVWDWGWHGHGDAPGIIRKLPENTWLMSVSEWNLPIERGRITSRVGEYSISAVGPGPRAQRHWQLARQRGLKTVAKVQLNATWEIATVPYLPVLNLVADHCEHLARSHVDGLMLSWTVGGFPSPNLEIARRFSRRPIPNKTTVLNAVARERFGDSGAPHARRAWTAFSRAFAEYPFHVSVVYNAPVQIGPANPLFLHPTGYRATMTGIPYDDLKSWRGPYPPETFITQFDRLAKGWQQGIDHLARAVADAPQPNRSAAQADLRLARATHAIFRSVRNQARFVLLRNHPKSNAPALVALLNDEMSAAESLYHLAKDDSRIGFEAANQYFFVPNDLLEKLVQCQFLKNHLAQ